MLTLKQYWELLDNSIKTFESFKTTVADQKNFEYQKATLVEMFRRGMEIENLTVYQKYDNGIRLAREFKETSEQAYKNTGTAPLIEGPLSCTFAELVYLPHLERLANVNFGYLATIAPDDLTPKLAKEFAANSASILRQRIDAYKKAHPDFKITPINTYDHLKQQAQSLTKLLNIIQNLHAYDKQSKTSLKQILDPYNQFKSVDEYLDHSHLTDHIKQRIREHENLNTFWLGKKFLFYQPEKFLTECAEMIADEITHINKQITDAHPAHKQSLTACLNVLLHKRKSSFYHSNKCNIIKAITNNNEHTITDVKEEIAYLKLTVSPHRDEEKWYVPTIGRRSRSLTIFNQFFDSQNNPLPVANLAKRLRV